MCVLHVWLRASSSSFRLCASTHSVDLRPVVVCVCERQGSAGPVVRVVTFRGVISHGDYVLLYSLRKGQLLSFYHAFYSVCVAQGVGLFCIAFGKSPAPMRLTLRR